jgi:multiple sugar transport system substrate-binding protein
VFYPFTWKQCNVKHGGKVQLYGLPFETDIRVLYINRGALAAAGYSPSAAPKTWSQLASMANKLDQKKGSLYSVIAFYPEIGGSVALDTLNWLNGGSWENSKGAPTANSAQNVATGDWIKFWVDRYGGETGYNALNAQSQPGLDMFSSGLQVMHMDQPTYQDFTLVQHGVNFGIPSNSNSKISKIFPYWNVAYLPVGPSGKHPYSFSGGFAIGVPRKKQRSSAGTAAAWEFTKFMSLVGQLTFERYAGNIPTVISMAHDSFLTSKSHWSTFIAALKYGHAGDADQYDPLYPDDVLITGAPAAQNLIVQGKASPKDALDQAQKQALLNMKRTGGP